VNFTQSHCTEYEYNICAESTTFSGPTLNSGTYWINVQNASIPSGDPVYWDENSGPSQASESAVGSIPSESFTIFGTASSTVPEPSSLILFGSAILGPAGMLRRKLF